MANAQTLGMPQAGYNANPYSVQVPLGYAKTFPVNSTIHVTGDGAVFLKTGTIVDGNLVGGQPLIAQQLALPAAQRSLLQAVQLPTTTPTYLQMGNSPGSSYAVFLVFGAGLWVASGSDAGVVYTSPDLKTWTMRQVGGSTAFAFCAYGSGTFVLADASGNVYTSADAITWTSRGVAVAGGVGLVFGAGIFVLMTASANYATSTNGVTWTSNAAPAGGVAGGTIAYNGTLFCLASGGPTVYISSTGLAGSWTTQAITGLVGTNKGVSAANGIFFVTDTQLNGGPWTSINGVTWVRQSIVGGNYAAASVRHFFVYGNGVYIGMALGNSILTSTDALNFTPSSFMWTPNGIGGLGFSNNMFFCHIAGGGQALWYSTANPSNIGVSTLYTQTQESAQPWFLRIA